MCRVGWAGHDSEPSEVSIGQAPTAWNAKLRREDFLLQSVVIQSGV